MYRGREGIMPEHQGRGLAGDSDNELGGRDTPGVDVDDRRLVEGLCSGRCCRCRHRGHCGRLRKRCRGCWHL
jgi:hypothetical protein